MTQFLVENSLYVVLVVAMIVLGGPLIYLAALDMRVRRIEEEREV